MKTVFPFLVFLFSASLAIAQQTKIDYGNNPDAGMYYNIRGIRLYCEIYGKGRPLLMLHGNGGSINAFSKNIPYFSKRYKVMAVDSRAHGKSIDNKDSLSFEMMADDFAALLDTLKIDSAYVIGWSDGGINAIEMAMRHPKKVIRFVSTGANVSTDSSAFVPPLWQQGNDFYEAHKYFRPIAQHEKNSWKLFMLDYTQPNIPWQQLNTIKCPALIMAGDKDLISLEHTIAIYRNIPRAQLWVMPNCGHGTLQEYPDEFNKKADAFFRQ